MSTNHNHTKPKTCKHKMAHCEHCDVAYCTACGKEWPSVRIENYKDIKPVPMPGGPQWLSNDPPYVLCNAVAGETGQRGVFSHSH